MSLKAMIWVRESAPTRTATEIVVLYSLADRANDDGTGAWPSRATLAEEARCSRATINRVLRELEDRQVIVRGDQTLLDRHNYPRDRRPVVWNLNMTLDRADEETGSHIETPPAEEETGSRERSDGVSPTTQRGIADDSTGYRGRDLNPPQSLLNPSPNLSPSADAAGSGPATVDETPEWETIPLIETPTLTAPRPGVGKVPDDYTPEFYDWYNRYPRKKEPRAALAAWWKAVRRIDREELNRRTDAYADWVRAGGISEKRYIPYPSTWLNGDSFLDDLDPIEESRPSSAPAGPNAWETYLTEEPTPERPSAWDADARTPSSSSGWMDEADLDELNRPAPDYASGHTVIDNEEI